MKIFRVFLIFLYLSFTMSCTSFRTHTINGQHRTIPDNKSPIQVITNDSLCYHFGRDAYIFKDDSLIGDARQTNLGEFGKFKKNRANLELIKISVKKINQIAIQTKEFDAVKTSILILLGVVVVIAYIGAKNANPMSGSNIRL